MESHMSKYLYELISLLTSRASEGVLWIGKVWQLRRTASKRCWRLWLVFFALAVLASLWGPLVASAQSSDSSQVHIVSWGETLHAISRQYGVNVEQLRIANNLAAPNSIYAGQRLIIPGIQQRSSTNPENPYHIVRSGENLFRIALRYDLSIGELAALNNLDTNDTLVVGQKLTLPTIDDDAEFPLTAQENENTASTGQVAQVYVVQNGDTLSSISRATGVSIASIVANNNILNPSSIHVGQRLVIPGAATVTSRQGYTPDETSFRHIVQAGETLTSIAAQYATNPWMLAQVNSIANPSLLYIGQILTIPTQDAVSRLANEIPVAPSKSIIVDVSEQRTFVYENGAIRWVFVSSTGIPGADTWRGEFQIQNKIQNAYASTWDLQMPYWMGFYWAGPLQNGFHALPILSSGVRLWENLLGRPASYGCVILSERDAQLLFEWAEIGTPVTVQD